MKVFEVTAAGFDGSTDDTDDRVFWINAPNGIEVLRAISNTGAKLCAEIEGGHRENVDFTLPEDTEKLRATLVHFTLKEE